MIDQDKMRALAAKYRMLLDDLDIKSATKAFTGDGRTFSDAKRAIEELIAELEAAAADKRDGWRSMDDAPLDGTWVMLFARYPEATASTPTFGFHREGKWWQSTRLGISELIPTYWMPRPAFPAALAQRQGEGS